MKLKLIILLVLGIWIGMVLGISFLEAPLKFRAPNITLPLGLGIGKLVFSALNKVEIAFSLILLFVLAQQFDILTLSVKITLLFIVAVVMIQSWWLLPILDHRIDQIVAGNEVPKTNHHFYYVFFEVLKLIGLFYAFIQIYHHE